MESSSLLNRVKALFLEQEKTVRAPAPAARPRSPNTVALAGALAGSKAEFGARLKTLLARHHNGYAEEVEGRLRIIDLREVKRNLGYRWETLSDRLQITMSKLIEDSLEKGDFYLPFDETTYVIALNDDSVDAARMKSDALTRSVKRILFGDGDSDATERSLEDPLLGETDVTAVTNRGMSASALNQLVRGEPIDRATNSAVGVEQQRESFVSIPAIASDDENTDDLQSFLRDSIAHLGILKQGAKPVEDGRDNYRGDTSARAERSAMLDGGSINVDAVIDALKDQAKARLSSLEETQNDGGRLDELSLEFVYEPIWYAPKNTIGMYRASILLAMPGENMTYSQLLATTQDHEFIALIDKVVLRTCISNVQLALSAGTVSVVSVPVSFRTLNWPRGQREYLTICREFTPGVRKLITWEIHDIPVEAWASRMVPTINMLKSFGRVVTVRLQPKINKMPEILRRLGSLKGGGAHSVQLDVNDLPGTETDKFKLLDLLATQCEAHELNMSVHGLSAFSLLTGAIGSGAQYVSGSAVAAPVTDLAGIHSKELLSIYAQHLSALIKEKEYGQ